MSLHKASNSLAMIILAVSVVSLSLIPGLANATTGMEITATAEGSSTIKITGQTERSMDVTLVITAPNGNVVSVAQLTPDQNGKFSTSVTVGGALGSQDGDYTITVNQGAVTLQKLSVLVEIVGGTVMTQSVTSSSYADVIGADVILSTPEKRGLTITADAVEGSTTIGISGHTDSTANDVTVTVVAPNGNIVSIAQLTPDANGNFMVDIRTGGPLWSSDGDYTITAQQGSSPFFVDFVRVEVIDGVVIPEFGTIAVLILAVAIVSIVAVSTRSKLSIMPKI